MAMVTGAKLPSHTIAYCDNNVDSRSRNLTSDGGPTITLEDPFAHSRQPSEQASPLIR
jgi:hypothetical protein